MFFIHFPTEMSHESFMCMYIIFLFLFISLDFSHCLPLNCKAFDAGSLYSSSVLTVVHSRFWPLHNDERYCALLPLTNTIKNWGPSTRAELLRNSRTLIPLFDSYLLLFFFFFNLFIIIFLFPHLLLNRVRTTRQENQMKT